MEKINSLIKKMRFLYATKDCVSSSHYFGKLKNSFLTDSKFRFSIKK